MFKLVTYNPTLIKSAFTGINQIVNEVQIELDNDGLRLNAIDQSHITFVHLELEADSFDEYMIEEPLSFIISTDEFMKILSRSKNDDSLTLKSTNTQLIITFKGNATRTFKINLIDDDYESPIPPNINYDFQCTFQTRDLKTVLSDVGVFSDKLKLEHETSGDYLIIKGFNDFGETVSKYPIKTSSEEPVNSTYSLDKIRDFMKSEKFSEEILIKSGENIPLIIEFRCDDGVLSYLLAPRIEQEE